MAKHRRHRRNPRMVRNKKGQFVKKLGARANPHRKVRRRRRNPGEGVSGRKYKAWAKEKAAIGARGDEARKGSKSGRRHGPRTRKQERAHKYYLKRKAAMKKAGKKASRKSSIRRKKSGMQKSTATLLKQLKGVKAALKRKSKTRRKGRRSLQRRATRARYTALRLQLTHKRKGKHFPKHVAEYMRAHGLTRVNPSLGGMGKDLMVMLPQAGVFLGSMAGVSWVGTKLSDMLMGVKYVQQDAPQMVRDVLPSLSKLLVAGAAYSAARMWPQTSKWAGPIFFGGLAATAVQALFDWRVGEKALPLGSQFGLPLGEYVGVSGDVNVMGRQIAVDGFVEAGGANIAVDGLGEYVGVSGLGEYVGPDQYSIQGAGIFEGSTLGEASQLNEGRQPYRAWNEAPSVLDEVGDAEGGSLSGSIFD